MSEETFDVCDRADLRTFIGMGRKSPIHAVMLRLLDGKASEDDRVELGNFASSHHEAYPLTCEALVRVLDGSVL